MNCKFVTEETNLIKEIFKSFQKVVYEGTLLIDKDKILLNSFDPSNSMAIWCEISKELFTEYVLEDETKSYEVTLNIDELHKILKRAKDTEAITLMEENNQFIVKRGDNKRNTLPIIDTDYAKNEFNPAKLDSELKSKIFMDTGVLKEIIEETENTEEKVLFTLDKEKLNVSTQGRNSKVEINFFDTGDFKINYNGVKKDEEGKETPVDSFKVGYNQDFLQKIVSGLADKTTLELAEGMPLRYTYDIPNKVKMVLIIAPLVDND